MSDYQPTGMSGSVVGVKTAVETPAAVFAGASALVGRSRLRIANQSDSLRVRVGIAATNLQRDGIPVEPGDSKTIYPTGAVYACSEGAPVTIQIEEK